MLLEESLGRLALDHQVGDCVGVAFVSVAHLPDTRLELDAASLLDDVGGFVRRVCKLGGLANATCCPDANASAPIACAA